MSAREPLRRSVLYLFSSGLQQLGGLLLLPLLVATLDPEEFSRYGLLTSAYHLLVPALSLNLHLAPSRLIFDTDNARQRARLLVSTLVASTGLLTVGLVVLLGILQLTGWREPISLGDGGFQLLVAVICLAYLTAEFCRTVLRVRGEAGRYTLLMMVQSGGLLGLFVLLRGFLPGFAAVLWAYVLSQSLTALLGLSYARRDLRGGGVDRSQLRAALTFSWPTVVHLLAWWGIGSSGRWIGASFLSLREIAPYTLVTLLVAVVMMVSRALFEARLPEIGSAFAAQRLHQGRRVIVTTVAIALGLVVATYGAAHIALFELGLSLPAGYEPEPRLLLFAALVNLLDVVYVGGSQVLQALKKTRTQAAATVTAGVVTVLLNLLLVRLYGVDGLMLALILGTALQALISNGMARRRFLEAEHQAEEAGT